MLLLFIPSSSLFSVSVTLALVWTWMEEAIEIHR